MTVKTSADLVCATFDISRLLGLFGVSIEKGALSVESMDNFN